MDKVNSFLSGIWLPLDTIITFAIIILVFIVVLVISKIIAWLIWKTIKKANFIKSGFEKLGFKINLEKVGNITARIVYFLLLFALFIGALESKYINIDTSNLPLIGDLKGFVESILKAWVIAVVAFVLANLAKVLVSKTLSSNSLDKKISDSLDTKWNISETLATVSYWAVIFFFLPSVLNSLGLNDIANQITWILNSIIGYFDDVLWASLIIVIFYFVGKIISKIVADFLNNIGFNKVLELIGLKNVNSKTTPSSVIWSLIFAYIILFAITEASKTLGLTSISTMVSEIIAFSVNIILGVVILGIGLYLANLASNAIKSTTSSKILPAIWKYAIIILTSFMALQQMQIGWEIVNQAFTLLLWAIAVAFALAVWLWAKDVAWEEIKKLIENMKK